MNRTELIEAVAERAGSDPAVARRHVDAVFEAVMDGVAAGERVVVTGFGTFDRLSRPARTARNPRTGLPIEVAATEVPRFRVGQTFRTRVAPAPEPPAEPEAPKKAKKSKKDATAKKAPKKTKAAAKPAPAKKKGKGKGGK